MIYPELFSPCFVLECLVKFANEFEGRVSDLVLTTVKPNTHMSCVFVDSVHELDLLASLFLIVLVDANLIDPKTALPIRPSQAFQSAFQASSDSNEATVAYNLSAPVQLAPKCTILSRSRRLSLCRSKRVCHAEECLAPLRTASASELSDHLATPHIGRSALLLPQVHPKVALRG